MEEFQEHPRAEASIDQGGVSSASPAKKQRGPLILCCILALVLVGAVVMFAVFSKHNPSVEPSDIEVVANEDGEEFTDEDYDELVKIAKQLNIEITDETTFADLADAMAAAGIQDHEDVVLDESWKIGDDYCGDADCKAIDVEYDENFFGAYTNSAAGDIMDTVYAYFASVYPEYNSITYMKDSWYGNSFKIKADDGTLFDINVATQLSKYNQLLNVTKVSIFTAEKQQIFTRDITPSDDPEMNVPMSYDMTDEEWNKFDLTVNDIGDDE